MNTFAFVRSKKELISNNNLFKYIKNNGFMDLFKIGVLSFFLLSIAVIYLYYVNLASTRGYFLKQANQKYIATTFKFEILKTQLLECKQKNWEKMHALRYKSEVIKINTEVVYIPNYEKLAFNK